MRQILAPMISGLLLAAAPLAAAPTLAPAPAGTAMGAALPLHIGGRVDRRGADYVRQWPGTYFEAAFRGTAALLRVGPGDVVLNVAVDGVPVTRLVKPQPGLYRIGGLTPGRHAVRVDVASESQSAPTMFGGLHAVPGATPLTSPARARQIEFIGDSHTVGYANLSTKRDCSEAEVWTTTDTSRGVAPLTARRYDADYRVNAISGRGIVRNYDGGPGDTVPVAYPFTLFDHATRAADAGWNPRLVVIALGTNDFTTPLHAGEPWKTRAALTADYQTRYMAFVRMLHAKYPAAHVLIWATDMANGEIATAASGVVARLQAAGDTAIGFVPVPGLALSSCHYHPSAADDGRIATVLAAYVDAHPAIWGKSRTIRAK